MESVIEDVTGREPAEDGRPWDVLIVGAGPTGLAVASEAKLAGLSAVLLDKGALTANLLEFPAYMRFFTTRDRLEIGGVPFSVPDEKPDLRQALVYYRAVVRHHDLEVRAHEAVTRIESVASGFRVHTQGRDGADVLAARNVVVATGYFGHPRRLGVPGEELDWVHTRYRDPYRHFDEHVALIGAGNSACEAALELWRAGAQVTLIHRRSEIKPTVKYWVKPDIENRIAEGSIEASLESTVERFADGAVVVRRAGETVSIPVDAAYTLIGYGIDSALLSEAGVEVSEEEQIPHFAEETGETNVAGLYIAGAVRSGIHTNRIFIDNSRQHGADIVAHIAAKSRTR